MKERANWQWETIAWVIITFSSEFQRKVRIKYNYVKSKSLLSIMIQRIFYLNFDLNKWELNMIWISDRFGTSHMEFKSMIYRNEGLNWHWATMFTQIQLQGRPIRVGHFSNQTKATLCSVRNPHLRSSIGIFSISSRNDARPFWKANDESSRFCSRCH